MILFIENCVELNIFEIATFLDLDLFDLWKILNPFCKFDGLIPNVIIIHFSAIEIQIFTFLIWQKNNKFKATIGDFFKNNTLDISDLKNYSGSSFDDDMEKLEFNNQSLFVYQ